MKRRVLFIITVIGTILFIHSVAWSQETYHFERMFPTLKQPWHFAHLGDIAIDSNWNIYVESNDRILKLTSDGEFIAELDFSGRIAVDTENNIYVMRSNVTQKLNPNGDVIFDFPFGGRDIALDKTGNIYVLTDDIHHNRVEKYDSEGGELIKEWLIGDMGTKVTVDKEEYVHVLLGGSQEVIRFSPDGVSSARWTIQGYWDGGADIEVDCEGNFYVAWSEWATVQKYTSDGRILIASWVASGTDKEFISAPYALAIDPGGSVYVSESGGGFDEAYSNVIRKFTTDLSPITIWGSLGYSNGKFHSPAGVAVDQEGNIYVTEKCTTRIQKFSPHGEFLKSWNEGGSTGVHNAVCGGLRGIAIDPQRNVYVADSSGDRVQKFTSDGIHISTWGSSGDYDVYATFDDPTGIAVDQAGNIYVADPGRIQKFDTQGNLIHSWNAKTYYLMGPVAVGPQGNIYVTGHDSETGGYVVQKFSPNGTPLGEWGSSGAGYGQFFRPEGIAVDREENVYIADTLNNRIQKCNNNGSSCAQWGGLGTKPGAMIEPSGITVDSEGKVIITDTLNNRIQVFTREGSTGNTKAVIVAGGGPYPGNNLWDATQMTANFAWWTLLHQGFTKEDIYYLSGDTDLDIDDDEEADVYGDATTVNLRDILEGLASDEEVDSVLLYLTDHGGEHTFSMSGGEILHASNNVANPGHDLASWLVALAPKQVTVVYDACESGSFVDDLQGDNRIIITSSSDEEQAKFLNQGTISFSYFFWSYIFNGASLDWAFFNASQAVNFVFSDQTPQMVGDTEHIGIGNETEGMIGDAPVIGGEVESSPPELTLETSAVLSVDGVVDPNNDTITRVWAVVWPPDYETGSVDDPLLDLPTVDLEQVDATRYEGVYSEFHAVGTYQIAVYAMDEQGNTSLPSFTIVPKSVSRRAVIVAGATGTNIDLHMIEHNARLAYNTLISQHYDSAAIYLMSNTTFLEDVSTYGPTISNFKEDCLDRFIGNDETIENLDLTIYLIGASEHGNFILNDDPEEYEALSGSQLADWLDELQAAIRGRTTVICDFDRSGTFMGQHTLNEGSQRITITSTGEETAAYFNSQGNISFSSFLWDQLAAGAGIRDAFIYAKKAIAYCSLTNDVSFSCYMPQIPLIDANSNGIPNEPTDYGLVEELKIGDGIVTAADPPQIDSVSVVREGEMITITAENISSTSPIVRVWAIINPLLYCPGISEETAQEVVEIDLEFSGVSDRGENYAITYGANYACRVTVYAMSGTEEEPVISLPFESRIYQEGGDIYEPDYDASAANVIVVNYPTAQPHTFHQCDDQDWVKFYGVEKEDTYTIEAGNLGDNFQDYPPVLELYDGDDLTEPISVTNIPPVDGKVWIDFRCTADGIYYVKLVWGGNCDEWVEDKSYDLRVYDDNIGLTAIVRGKIRDRVSGRGIDGAVIRSSGVGATISTHGEYLLSEIPGTWTIRGRKSGYTGAIAGIRIDSHDQQIRKDLSMSPQSRRCIEDTDCDDGDYCNGVEVCTNGVCQSGVDPCGDDGLYCNGEEGVCDEDNDMCEHSGSPCPGHQACVEESDECIDKECASNEDCDDGQFCNGVEVCINDLCQAGIYPCADPTPACDEEQDICIEGPSIQLLPNPCLQSRWIPLPMFLRIVGTNTHFDTSSLVTFNPPGAIMALPILGDNTHLFMIGLLMPSWLAPAESVDVIVATGSELISAILNLDFLPFMMGEQKEIY